MIIQTTDNVLYNISIFGRDTDVDCAVDLMQFARPLHLNESETAYQWWGRFRNITRRTGFLGERGIYSRNGDCGQ